MNFAGKTFHRFDRSYLLPVNQEMTDVKETLDVARKRNAKKKAKTRLKVYRKALEEVQQIAGNDSMRELADWIRNQIREREVPPSGRSVRKKGPRSVAITGRRCLLDLGSERRPHNLPERVTHRG